MTDGRQRQLAQAVQGLMTVRPGRGLAVTAFNIVVLNGLLLATFTAGHGGAFLALAVATAVFYGSVMMTTHDAIHHTLTGWYLFDEIVPRCFAYFVFWPHGLYSELHKLHHRLNGRDLDDPERPTYAAQEYRAASPIGRFVIRHQWWLSLFVFGGIGMLAGHVRQGLRLRRRYPALTRALVTDAAGILASMAMVVTVVLMAGIGWRFLVYIAAVERVIGFVMQLRSHVEHYGLNGDAGSLVETRLASCRNIATNRLASRYVNGLNYHSVHHAFPRIPFYHLAEAHARIGRLSAAAGRPLPEGTGYVRTCLELARRPLVLRDDGRGSVEIGHALAPATDAAA
jgi:fatty acid desaturase